MVKFGFLARRERGRIALSEELARSYLRGAPILFGEGDQDPPGPLKRIILRERSSRRALKDAMDGKAPLSDTLAYLMGISLSEELKNDMLIIYAWLYRQVLGEKPPIRIEVPEILPKFLEDVLDRLRTHVLELQLRKMGLL